MAIRPIFIPLKGRPARDGSINTAGPLVERLDLSIKWHGGFAVSQKQKNILELHEAARIKGISPVLEISTKSTDEVGRRLSAFSLKIEVTGVMRSLESTYQSSKVFSGSGQHLELLDADPFFAKKEIRRLGRGNIVGFRFEGADFPTEPKNAFYDWLYIRAILPHEGWIKRNLNYSGYSDIEFTPDKSINCQARAVAEFHALSMRGEAANCANDFNTFRNLLLLAQREDATT
jgi:hypothetical protein